MAQVGPGGDDVEGLVAHILGMRRGEAYPHIAGSLGHQSQQGGEIDHRAVGPLVAVRVDILPQQRHLLEALGLEVGQFAQNALGLTAALPPAGIGYNTIGAEIIAPPHDGDKTRNAVQPDARGNHLAIGLGSRELHVHRLLTMLGSPYQIGQVEVRVGAGHQIDTVLGNELLAHPFGHTAQHPHHQMFVMLAQRLEIGQTREHLLLGIVANGTGIDKNGIGLLDGIAQRVTGHLHDRGHHLAVGHVHLATIGLDKEFLLCNRLPNGVLSHFHIFHSIRFILHLILIYQQNQQKSNIFFSKICFLKNNYFLCNHIT